MEALQQHQEADVEQVQEDVGGPLHVSALQVRHGRYFNLALHMWSKKPNWQTVVF